ncbi:efflux RND transporter periplasmic adaptor subunit [Sphingomonas suaedae]|uniref:Efflux RND transporter periplasmic adaptor subunit n=1 Tax=Sphingomonas suaedae TaxID=2599297 RepID=A0A518RIL2_9SPHN|nr:efflux RND transporter periplasmic adaptor subunit [Sphingomonas suaedae]QDX27298.1 efflux RND transporter periplasmic adaptor subunit [Sphingomonas suaedae]
MVRSLVLLAAPLLLASCDGGEPQDAPAPAAAIGERLTIRSTPIAATKPLAAEIATRDQAEALARIPGTLVELTVREGDLVRQGQRIGRIIDTRIGYETRALGAQAAAASAQAEAARAELTRIEYLYNRGVYAKARLDQARATARSAEAQVRAARDQQSASAALAGQGTILAPATGRVLRADIPRGSVVAPGMSIATITSGPPLLRLDIPQSLARALKLGTRVTVEDASELGGKTGTVVQLYPAVSGGRVRADVALAGLTTDLVGRRVGVRVALGSRSGIAVPQRFVTTRFGTDYVLLLGKDGRTSLVPVQTAPIPGSDSVEILSGVAPGDVVAAGKSGR